MAFVTPSPPLKSTLISLPPQHANNECTSMKLGRGRELSKGLQDPKGTVNGDELLPLALWYNTRADTHSGKSAGSKLGSSRS